MERTTPLGYSVRLIVILALAALVFLPSFLRLFDTYELETLDFRFLIRPQPATVDDIAFIEIGEDTIKKIGRWPFERSYHALLVKALSEAGARSVIFDIFFSEPEEHDREFAEALGDAGTVYLPHVLDVNGEVNGVPLLSARGYIGKTLDTLAVYAKGTGHINIVPDKDGKFRRIPLYIRYGQTLHPYISFLAASDYLGISRSEIKLLPGRYVLLGRYGKVPIDDESFLIVNFSGRWGDVYEHYSYVDVLQSYFAQVTGKKPTIDLSEFKNKICIVGLTAAGTGDIHPNPFETLYPGMGMHAELINSLITKRFIVRASRGVNLAILAFVMAAMAFVTMRMRPIRGLAVLVGMAAIFIIGAIALFILRGIWVDLFYPVLVMVLLYLSLTVYKYVAEWKGRLLLENELGIARKIQESFLPKHLPERPGLDIAVAMFTARQVGGDLYNAIELDADRTGVMIGDVSGKGVPASLFMALVTGKFTFFATPDADPHAVLATLNTTLIKESSSNLFVTVFYLIIDLKRKMIRYSNGGHLPLLHIPREGKPVFLDVEEGAPLGLFEGPYATKEAAFGDGDTLILYTDGITEAMNARSEMYGSDRMVAVAVAKRRLSARDILAAIAKDVRAFEPRSRQHDDMTVIVIKTG